MVLGGLIGMERESINRPAGFRTHTLVCMGSTLVMLTANYIFEAYYPQVNLDPARLGAQVISGIGFLGAGTILKTDSHIRGLTTAASLWVVACVGLAIGAGFYAGAVIAAILTYITLILFKKVEGFLNKSAGILEIDLELKNIPGQIAKVTEVMGRLRVEIRDIKMTPTEDPWVQTRFFVKLPHHMQKETLLAELSRLDGVVVSGDEQ